MDFTIFMGFHGFSWVFMGFHWFSWVFMVFHRFSWFFMGFMFFERISWFFMGFHGFFMVFEVKPMNFEGFSWVLGFHGFHEFSTTPFYFTSSRLKKVSFVRKWESLPAKVFEMIY